MPCENDLKMTSSGLYMIHVRKSTRDFEILIDDLKQYK